MLKLDALVLKQGDFEMTAQFDVLENTRTAIIGPSGAGKSTLLMALAGFLNPTKGAIIWQGSDITRDRPADRPFSVLFQDNNLFAHMSIAQNVGLGLRPSLRLSASELDRVADALGSVGLSGRSNSKPADLSGGQQSRAALARVLVQRKPVILLDEPFAALGPALKADMLDLVAQVCEETGAGLMMISHDPADALRICDQTILVADGQAHPPTNTKELLNNPPTALRDYLGA